VGGALVGLITGYVSVWMRRRLDDPPVQIMVSLLTPFAAYLPSETLGVSGIVAAVIAAL